MKKVLLILIGLVGFFSCSNAQQNDFSDLANQYALVIKILEKMPLASGVTENDRNELLQYARADQSAISQALPEELPTYQSMVEVYNYLAANTRLIPNRVAKLKKIKVLLEERANAHKTLSGDTLIQRMNVLQDQIDQLQVALQEGTGPSLFTRVKQGLKKHALPITVAAIVAIGMGYKMHEQWVRHRTPHLEVSNAEVEKEGDADAQLKKGRDILDKLIREEFKGDKLTAFQTLFALESVDSVPRKYQFLWKAIKEMLDANPDINKWFNDHSIDFYYQQVLEKKWEKFKELSENMQLEVLKRLGSIEATGDDNAKLCILSLRNVETADNVGWSALKSEVRTKITGLGDDIKRRITQKDEETRTAAAETERLRLEKRKDIAIKKAAEIVSADDPYVAFLALNQEIIGDEPSMLEVVNEMNDKQIRELVRGKIETTIANQVEIPIELRKIIIEKYKKTRSFFPPIQEEADKNLVEKRGYNGLLRIKDKTRQIAVLNTLSKARINKLLEGKTYDEVVGPSSTLEEEVKSEIKFIKPEKEWPKVTADDDIKRINSESDWISTFKKLGTERQKAALMKIQGSLFSTMYKVFRTKIQALKLDVIQGLDKEVKSLIFALHPQIKTNIEDIVKQNNIKVLIDLNDETRQLAVLKKVTEKRDKFGVGNNKYKQCDAIIKKAVGDIDLTVRLSDVVKKYIKDNFKK